MDHIFGSYLKEMRENKGWSINQLAQAADISGSQISRIENGLRGIPKPQTLRKMAEALEVPYEELMNKAGYLQGSLPSTRTSRLPLGQPPGINGISRKCLRMTVSSCLTASL